MLVIWGLLAGILLYLELVYHFTGYGFCGFWPIYTIMLIMVWSGVISMLVGVAKGRYKKLLFYGFMWFAVTWYGAQLVYLRIFKQPLLLEAMVRGGGDALTNYWREALLGVVSALPFLLLLVLPAVMTGIALHKKALAQYDLLQVMRTAVIIVLGIAGAIVTMEVGKAFEKDYYEEYHEFYDPMSVACTMGVLPMVQRDCVGELGLLTEQWEPDVTDGDGSMGENDLENTEEALPKDVSEGNGNTEEPEEVSPGDGETGQESGQETVQETVLGIPQQFFIDYERLRALADNKKQLWLADYIQEMQPTKTNEYTGMFKGYNLIFLTAEGFSPYAIREDLTPTLYKLTHSGFVFENYYVPLWQTSTSDGEYINCTGLIPDGQFSLRKSGANYMPYTLPGFFAKEGVHSYGYHNNTLTYYDRYITHPNLGYDFKGCKLGNLSEEEWGSQIFPMEHPDEWPSSDLEMIQGTASEYLEDDRFHVYYMTVSGHMNYNFKGNAMSYKNKDGVAGLDMSVNARAYLACNMELDKALESLLAQLEATGNLENTVICMSADHYPYAMTNEQYEELAGKTLNRGMDKFRNCMVLWNEGMEEPVVVEKACGSMDILPTLLNLFGFAYDSRMYAGRDIFAEEEGLVIFNDRSFVTDAVIYNRKEKETLWLTDKEGNPLIPTQQQEEYLKRIKQEVKNRYQFSAYILQENYYKDVEQAINTGE